MSFTLVIKTMVAALLLPPLNGLLLLLLAWLIRRRRTAALSLAWAGGLLLVALSLKPVGMLLIGSLESQVNVAVPKQSGAQAIVVLTGGRYRAAPEYGGDTVSDSSLVRLRYAAKLHRETGLPLLITGGAPDGHGKSEAEAMTHVLENEYGVTVRWREEGSDDTADSAVRTAVMLAAAGIKRILLVSHAYHLPRARFSFERAGLMVIPAPTAFYSKAPLTPQDWLPREFRLARIALHEWIGILWYRLRSV